MATNSLAGRKQTPEHVAKRVESIRKTRESWSEEKRRAFSEKIARAIKARPRELQERFAYSGCGREPWNKGKKNPKISGENHWNWGNNMPQESIEKMRESLKGKKQSPEVIAKRVAARAGYNHSLETKEKIGKANSGEGNGNWLGGITPYHGWSFRLREDIRVRDGRTCRVCGKPENGKHHDVHHIDYDKRNIHPDNLVTLCHYCHGKTNYNRDQWQRFFNEQKNILIGGQNEFLT